ncbi:acyl-CoA/acyl-ACP dehydrogenase [Yinghuangia sp. ASG 101]|uniref:acyl-CoA dehydrogenase family protein n=1 Tax=Yinghuangia sp. ASG 101 TaxID=2896848 RepID=UPI001E4F6F09|nr:acyl-CoA dehydrogenase family protein [Yinghuangia sp. ASG 101]UGQ11231.1 acyl-CoA/acyl-ACP dehydrogenase [Yinghuangia sp. ASG 101]
MELTFTDEQEELRKTVRAFFARHATEADVRRLAADDLGHDPAVWRRMGEELGLQGLAVPEEYGGAGFGYVELGIVCEEAGRALLCGPYFASVALGAEALIRAGDDQAARDLLPGISVGTTIATLALTEDEGRWDEAGVRMAATLSGDTWTLTGTKTYVPDGHIADLLLVAARTDTGISLFAVEAEAEAEAGAGAGAGGVTRTLLPALDQTRRQARVDFDGARARLIGREGAAWPVIEGTLATAAILLAAEQVGGASAALDAAVEYAKVRVQYGRAIGSFQGVKHRCADMLTAIESARSAAYGGLWALASGNAAELGVAAALAKVSCSETFTEVAGGNIQVHGAIGFTWEHPAHLYFKRAKSSEVLLGTPAYHRELLAAGLGF